MALSSPTINPLNNFLQREVYSYYPLIAFLDRQDRACFSRVSKTFHQAISTANELSVKLLITFLDPHPQDGARLSRTSKTFRQVISESRKVLEAKSLPSVLTKDYAVCILGFLSHQDRVHLSCTSKIAYRAVKHVRTQEEVHFRKQLKPFFGQNPDSALYKLKVNTFLLRQRPLIPVSTWQQLYLNQRLKHFLQSLPIIDEVQVGREVARLNAELLILFFTKLLEKFGQNLPQGKSFLDSLKEIQNPFKKAAEIREWILANKQSVQKSFFPYLMQEPLKTFLGNDFSIELFEKFFEDLSIADKIRIGKRMAHEKAEILIRFFTKLLTTEQHNKNSEATMVLQSLEAIQDPLKKADAIREWIRTHQEDLTKDFSTIRLYGFINRYIFQENLEIPEEIILLPNIDLDTFKQIVKYAAKNNALGLMSQVLQHLIFLRAVHLLDELFDWIMTENILTTQPQTMDWCVHSEASKNVSIKIFSEALSLSIKKHCERIAQKIIRCNRFREIPASDLGEALRESAYGERIATVEQLLNCSRFQEISASDLGEALKQSAYLGRTVIVQQLLNCSRFQEISASDLGEALKQSAYLGHTVIVQQLLDALRSNRFSMMAKVFILSRVWHIPEAKAILQPEMDYGALVLAYFLSFDLIFQMAKKLMHKLNINY